MDRFVQALEGAADGAFFVDRALQITYWNRAAQEILGYSRDDVAGKPCFSALRCRDDRGRLICRERCWVAERALRGRSVTSFDACAVARSGDLRWIHMSILTYQAQEADPVVVHFVRDAAHRKQSEKLIQQVVKMAGHLRSESPSRDSSLMPETRAGDRLTPREREVLRLLAEGLNTQGIARSLFVSPTTVRNHVQNLLQKLNLHSRVEVVAYAYKHGLVDGD